MARNYYYVKEAAALLGCSTQWLTRVIGKGELEANRLGGGRWRIPTRAIRAFAEKSEVELNWPALQAMEERRKLEAQQTTEMLAKALEADVRR